MYLLSSSLFNFCVYRFVFFFFFDLSFILLGITPEPSLGNLSFISSIPDPFGYLYDVKLYLLYVAV